MPGLITEDIGFLNQNPTDSERLLTIRAEGNTVVDGKSVRKLGVRFIRNSELASGIDLELVPAVFPSEWKTQYAEKPDGFEVVLNSRLDQPTARNMVSKDIWLYQKSPYLTPDMAPPLNAEKYPFQNALRRNAAELPYNPVKAKYFDFREDHSPESTGELLNTFDLTSTVPLESDYGYDINFFGNDVRKWIVIALEFTDSNGDQVMNKIFPEPHPGIVHHYFVMDFTRTRDHIETDLNEQLARIHPEITASLDSYEGPVERRLKMTVPLGWTCTRREYVIGLYSESGEEGLAADGKNYDYQEEIEIMNNGGGRVLSNPTGGEGQVLDYLEDPIQNFPFPAPLYYPYLEESDVEVLWPSSELLTDGNWVADKQTTIETVITPSDYVYDQNRPWQLFARLKFMPATAGEIAIKEAYWTIHHPGDELPTKYPAHFIRQISGLVPVFNATVFGEGPQIASVFELDNNSQYTKRKLLRDSTLYLNDEYAYMRVTPPPVDGYGTCP